MLGLARGRECALVDETDRHALEEDKERAVGRKRASTASVATTFASRIVLMTHLKMLSRLPPLNMRRRIKFRKRERSLASAKGRQFVSACQGQNLARAARTSCCVIRLQQSQRQFKQEFFGIYRSNLLNQLVVIAEVVERLDEVFCQAKPWRGRVVEAGGCVKDQTDLLDEGLDEGVDEGQESRVLCVKHALHAFEAVHGPIRVARENRSNRLDHLL